MRQASKRCRVRPPSEPIEPIAVEEKNSDGTEPDPWAVYRPYLTACLEEDSISQKAIAREKGLPEEVLADEINALAADLLGDILLEESDCGFAVIEDYRDTLNDILSTM